MLFLTLIGNGYYIPNAAEQGLNVEIGIQTSRDQRDRKDTSARYATAWLDHGVDPNDKSYEYTILVNKPQIYIRVSSDQWAAPVFKLSMGSCN